MSSLKTKYAFFSGKIIPIEDANISIRTCVIHYGIGIFEGITLDSLVTIIKDNDLGLEVERRTIDRTELYICDEALYCGTGAQVTPIISIDKRKVGDGNIGEYTKKLQNIFFGIVRGGNNQYKHWCTEV